MCARARVYVRKRTRARTRASVSRARLQLSKFATVPQTEGLCFLFAPSNRVRLFSPLFTGCFRPLSPNLMHRAGTCQNLVVFPYTEPARVRILWVSYTIWMHRAGKCQNLMVFQYKFDAQSQHVSES